MVYKDGVLENSFIFQSHELVMNLVSDVGGNVIFDSTGCPGIKIDNSTRVNSSTNLLVLKPIIDDIMSIMSCPISVKKVWM